MKASHIPTMLELLVRGAKDRPVMVTTKELAKRLGKSQQMASKHLEEMEREGLIERIRSGGGSYVKATRKGVQAAKEIYSTLQSVFGQPLEAVDVNGKLFSGLGEGAYYVSMKGYRRQFLTRLGFDPYPGTFNIRLETEVDKKIRRDLAVAKGIHIEGFEDGRRTFGGAECFNAVINGKVRAAVLVIERTSYDDSVLEVISPVNIRNELYLTDGDRVRVTIFLQGENCKQPKGPLQVS
jgi:riboflavin kinase